jgi:bifunctional non-homologous end joining protein LigD
MTDTFLQEESISLFFKEGSSDKVYKVSLNQSIGGWVVDVNYGRRGGTLNALRKCTGFPYDKAKKLYDRLIAEKEAKGYRGNGSNATGYTKPDDQSKRLTEYRPQLLMDIREDQIEERLNSDDWLAQEKEDGRRIALIRSKDGVIGANRKGLQVAIPENISKAILKVHSPYAFMLDGEMIGDKFKAFDLLHFEGMNLEKEPYQVRLARTMRVLNLINAYDIISHTATAYPAWEKRELYKKLKEQNREGIVFKRKDAWHVPGRSSAQVKFKFWATASVVVEQVNEKRSVLVKVWDEKNDTWEIIGNVSVPVNHTVPVEGDIVDVRYLYAYKGGSLFQPQYEGKRDDIELEACTIEQLKYKNEEAE